MFVIEKTASGWWLAAPAGRMESIIPGYIEARNVFIGPYTSNQIVIFRILRVVQTKAILYLKLISERVVSDMTLNLNGVIFN